MPKTQAQRNLVRHLSKVGRRMWPKGEMEESNFQGVSPMPGTNEDTSGSPKEFVSAIKRRKAKK